MPGKITELTTLTGVVANGSDLLEAVDISDTSMAATGTNKRLSLTNLIAFLNANGVGASSNEVYIGPNDPIGTNPDAELWLDTDAVPALLDDTRWNTAWGVVKTAPVKPYNGTAFTTNEATPVAITEDMTVTLVAGRRYRFVCALRAMSTAAPTTVFLKFDGPGIPANDYYRQVSGSYESITSTYYLDGTGAAGTYRWCLGTISPQTTVNLWTSQAVTYFICEDVGPATSVGSTPQPTAGLEAIKPVTPGAGFRFFATDTKRDWLYDGTGWIIMSEPTQTYTPTLTQVTLGAGGASTGTYHRSDGWCDFHAEFALGAGGALTGQASLTLPFATALVQRYQFAVSLYDVTDNIFRGLHEAIASGGTVIFPFAVFTSGPTEAGANISATSPFPWTSSDNIRVVGRYRLNSRYS
jgi:hypothetical protein